MELVTETIGNENAEIRVNIKIKTNDLINNKK